MKQGTNPRRSRGRNNNNSGSGGNNNSGNSNNGGGRRNSRNQSYESNGPDVKVRGSAQQVLDKYLQLARDSQSGGDRVKAEAYLQFAEHYYRIVNADSENDQARTAKQGDGGDQPAESRQPSSQQAVQQTQQPARNVERQVDERPANERPASERPAGRGRGRPVQIKNEATLAAEAAAANEAALKAAQANSEANDEITPHQDATPETAAQLPLAAPVKAPAKPRARRVKPVEAEAGDAVESKAVPA